MRLASPNQGDKTSIISQLSKLQHEIYQGLFLDSMSSHGTFEEREEVGMGCRVPSCLPKAQGCGHLKTSFETAQVGFRLKCTRMRRTGP